MHHMTLTDNRTKNKIKIYFIQRKNEEIRR